MLYLKRKIGERILINETVEMTVIEIKGKMVRLGFTNPPGTTVRRIPTEKTAKNSAEPATVATEKREERGNSQSSAQDGAVDASLTC